MFWRSRKKFSYTCACCGEKMVGSPSFAITEPPFIHDIPENERESRVKHDPDLCWIKPSETDEQEIFAIRVVLEIPIHGVEDPFTWCVWVTQSKQSFLRYMETCGEDQSGEVTFGWLPVTMAYYHKFNVENGVSDLPCDVHWQERGQRPVVTLHEANHPLYFDQLNGISWNKAIEIAQECRLGSHRSKQ